MASEKRYPIGSASIVMVFVAVCLTALSSLSLVSAKADLKTAQAVNVYYEADAKAAREVNAAEGDAVKLEQMGWQRQEGTLQKEFPLDDRQALRVTLAALTLEVEEWRVVITKEWVGDDSLDVWVP